MRSQLTYYLLFSFVVLIGLRLNAANLQNSQEIDSILTEATKNAYENPNKSISSGLSIYENKSYSTKIRTRGLILVSLGYTAKRDYQKALEYVIKANEMSSNLDSKKLQIDILFITGILYQQLKIYDKSIDYMDRIEKMALVYPHRDSVSGNLGSSYLVKGLIYKDNLNCDIALDYFNKAISTFDQLKKPINHNTSIAHYNKGNCYILLSEYENAKNSFNLSIDYAKLENANSLIAFAHKGLAEVYTLEGQYEESILLLKSALDESKNVGDLILNFGIYKGLYENYLALNQWEDYQKYYQLFLKTQLEIKISERNSVSDSIEENIKSLNENIKGIQIKFQNRLKWIILLLLVVIILVVFKEIKNRKKIKSLQKHIKTIQENKSMVKVK